MAFPPHWPLRSHGASGIWTQGTPAGAGRSLGLIALLLLGPFAFHASEVHAAGPTFEHSDLSNEFLSRLQGEARRIGAGHPDDPSWVGDPFDSVAEDLRAREAERIFTRALDLTLESRAEALARTSPGLLAALGWLDDFGGRSRSSPEGSGAASRAVDAALDGIGPAASYGPARGVHLGLRVGVQPRLVLRTGFGSLRARIEVPLPGRPVRLSVERPLGTRSRLLLTCGLGGGSDWAAFSLNLRF